MNAKCVFRKSSKSSEKRLFYKIYSPLEVSTKSNKNRLIVFYLKFNCFQHFRMDFFIITEMAINESDHK